MSSVADRLKISKADILNSESGSTNPAVKLALAETHVINETKKYLEDVGLQMFRLLRSLNMRDPSARHNPRFI